MDCKKIRLLLSAFINRELSKKATEKVKLHIETCQGCLTEYEELKETLRLLCSLEKIEPPLGFRERLYQRIKEESLKRIPLREKVLSWLSIFQIRRFQVATALVGLIIIAVITLQKREEQLVKRPPKEPSEIVKVEKEPKKPIEPKERKESPKEKPKIKEEPDRKKETPLAKKEEEPLIIALRSGEIAELPVDIKFSLDSEPSLNKVATLTVTILPEEDLHNSTIKIVLPKEILSEDKEASYQKDLVGGESYQLKFRIKPAKTGTFTIKTHIETEGGEKEKELEFVVKN